MPKKEKPPTTNKGSGFDTPVPVVNKHGALTLILRMLAGRGGGRTLIGKQKK